MTGERSFQKASLVGVLALCCMSFVGLGLVAYNAIREHLRVDARNELLSCLAATVPENLRGATREDVIDANGSGCAASRAPAVSRKELAEFIAQGPRSAKLAAWSTALDLSRLLGILSLAAGLAAFALVYLSPAGTRRALDMAGLGRKGQKPSNGGSES